MNRQEKIETPYFLNESVIGGGGCRSLEPYSTIFSFPQPNTRNYASHVEVVHQQPHQSGYQSSLLAFPDPTTRLAQSMMQPNLDSFGKPQLNSSISLFADYHAHSSSNNERNLQSRTTAEFSCSNYNMEKVLNSSWRELAGTEHRGNHLYSSSWMGSTGVQNIVPSGGATISKQRIRWTNELHEQFVEAVNSLGGAMKATPKGILRLMASQGLTIFHIKSHLQKYRTAKCTPNYLEGKNGKYDEVTMSNLKGNGGFQFSEALRLQMGVQKSLHEHLEFQKKLQTRIEEHANYLQKMFDQQKIGHNLFECHSSDNAIDTSITECSSTGGFGDRDEMFTTKLDP